MTVLRYLREGPRSVVLSRAGAVLAWFGLAISVTLVGLLCVYTATLFNLDFARSLGEFRYDYLDTRPLLDFIAYDVAYLALVGTAFARSRRICVIAGVILLSPCLLIAIPMALLSGVFFP